MLWDIEVTDEFTDWYNGLGDEDVGRVNRAVEVLDQHGPGTGRPFVDTIRGSRHANMKELRPRGGHLRILFAFDPRRTAVLLIGGDKTGEWSAWYARMIPIADAPYDAHLATRQRGEGETGGR